MVKGFCFTNLDEFKRCEWPVVFVAIPHVGDYVKASDEHVLRVVAITHGQRACKVAPFYEPYIRVELHK